MVIKAVQTSVFPLVPVDWIGLLPAHTALLFLLNRKNGAVGTLVTNLNTSLFEGCENLQRLTEERTHLDFLLFLGVLSVFFRRNAIGTELLSVWVDEVELLTAMADLHPVRALSLTNGALCLVPDVDPVSGYHTERTGEVETHAKP